MFFLQKSLCVIGLFLLLSFGALVHAEEEALPWDARIVKGTLDNGFRYYLFDSRQEDDAPKNLTLANLVVLSGAIDEEENQLGVAHMVEHMVFHESDGLPHGVRKAFTDMGLKQGRDFNAMTNSENTRYMVNLKNTTAEQLNAVLDIYQQMAFHAEIKATSLDKERLIIQEEWRGKLSHRSSINEEKKALLRVGSLYPERPVIGTQTTIKNTPATELRAFYKDWYAPNNMALVLYGPMDTQKMAANIKRIFGSEPKRLLPPRHAKDPVMDNELKIGQLRDPGSKVNRVAFLYRFKEEAANTKTARRDGLIDYMTRNLLAQQVRRQREVLPDHVRVLSSTKGSVSPNVAILGFSVNVDTGYHHLGLTALIKEIERIKAQGFYQEDFDQVYQKVIEAAERNKKAATSRGTIWSVKMVEAVTSDKVLYDPNESNDQVLDLVRTISLQDVNRRLRQWLSSADRILYTQATAGKPVNIGTEASVESVFDGLKVDELAALEKEKDVVLKALPKVTKEGKAVLLSKEANWGVSNWSLSNGDQLTLLDPKKMAERYQLDPSVVGEKTYFTAVSNAGYHVKHRSTWGQQIAVQLSNATGIYGWSNEEFDKWQKEHRVYLSSRHKATKLIYRASVEQDQLATLFGFYRINQVTPKIATEAYDNIMARLKRKTSIDVVRPIEAFARQLSKARFGEANQALRSADLEPLSLDVLQQIRQQQVSLPVHYFIVSPLAQSDMVKLAEKYLANIPRQPHSEVPHSSEILQQAGDVSVDVLLNTQPKAEYRLYAYQSVAWSPSAAVQLTYLGERLEAELKQRLRSEVQGVYSVRVGLELNPDSHRAELKIQYSSSPQRIEDLAKMTQKVLVDLPNMVTKDWVNGIQQDFAKVEQNRLEKDFNGALAHRLTLSQLYYGDSRYLHEMDELVKGLDWKKMQAMAARLRFENRVTGFYRPLDQ